MNHKRQLVLIKTAIVCTFALLLGVAWIHLTIGQTIFQTLLRPNKTNSTSALLLLDALAIDHPPIHAVSLNAINNDSIALSLQLRTQLNLQELLQHDPQESQSSILRWFIHRSPNSTISLNRPMYLYDTNPDNDLSSQPFIQINLLNSFKLPLAYHHPSAPKETLKTTSHLNLLIRILSPEQLNNFINQTIVYRSCHLKLSIQEVGVRLDADRFPSWLSNVIQSLSHFNLRGLQSNVNLKLPQLPPIFDRPSDLITIDDYSFYPIPSHTNASRNSTDDAPLIGIRARASIPNPVLELRKYSKLVETNVSIRWRIPLFIYKNDGVDPRSNGTTNQTEDHQPRGKTLMATALTIPFNLSDHKPRLTIPIEGSLVHELARLPDSGPLSDFLNEFLRGHSNNLTIRYRHRPISNYLSFEQERDEAELQREEETLMDRPFNQQLVLAETHQPDPFSETSHPLKSSVVQEVDSKLQPRTPKFISEFLSENLNLKIAFPGLINQTNLIKGLQIKDMKIDILSIIKREIRCSGKIEGVLDLPDQLKTLSNFINITQILPDVILLDGSLPDEYTNQTQLIVQDMQRSNNNEEYDEEEYPSNAFGKLDLKEYIPGRLIKVADGDNDTRIELRSEFQQVRLKVLEGRWDVFRRYATKYLLHHKSDSNKLLKSLKSTDEFHFDDQKGVLTSVLGTFSALGNLSLTFPLSLRNITFSGSFFV